MRYVIVQAPAPMRPGERYTVEVMSVKQGPEDLVPTAFLRIEGPYRNECHCSGECICLEIPGEVERVERSDHADEL